MRTVLLLGLAWVSFLYTTQGIHAAEPVDGLQLDKPATGRFVATDAGYMVPYRVTIPGTSVSFEMQPIPGGKFPCGSPASETKRAADEGPQFEAVVEPFWMGTYEVAWGEYKEYMKLNDVFKKLNDAKLHAVTPDNATLVITAPSNLYDPSFTFQLGQHPQQPAATMSQYSAKQYTKWLSGITGQFYRLPGEVEWEYACRAGSRTAYSFGDDPSQLKDYAWSFENSSDTTHKVGQRKPNAWGLHDMHGNVSEWVLDEFVADGYAKQAGKNPNATDAIVWPTKLFPRVVRGGSYDDDPERCRSAARKGSHDDDWRAEDPNVPKSPWWFTSHPALSVGFRILRPLQAPSAADRNRFWDADLELIRNDVNRRIDEDGRGGRGIADRELPNAIQSINARPK